VDTVLSAPPLPTSIQDASKIIIFTSSSSPPLPPGKRRKLSSTTRTEKDKLKERIVAVVVAQGIKWGMRVLRDGEVLDGVKGVDSGGGVYCEWVYFLPFTQINSHKPYTDNDW
jgi:N-acetyltransferase